MKKILVLFVILLAENYGFGRGVYEIDNRLKDRFHVLFPHAQGESWSEYRNQYVVSFSNDGTKERVFYTKDGAFIELIRYYGPDGLPTDIQLLLNEKLSGKKVYGVTEVSTVNSILGEDEIQYHISMEDEQKWYEVLVNNRHKPRIVRSFFKQ